MSIEVTIRVPQEHYDALAEQGVDVKEMLVENVADAAASAKEDEERRAYREARRERQRKTREDFARDNAPEWESGDTFDVGSHRWHDGALYRCIQAHTNHDPNHTPDATPALWESVGE